MTYQTSLALIALLSLSGCAAFGLGSSESDDPATLATPQDVSLGMPMNAVRALWGDPRTVEVAGDPGYGNEKWTYPEGISERWRMGGSRILYFERGRVAGWERR